MTRRKKRLSKGFTLVELMLVVVIIGMLAGLVIPNVTGMRRGAAIRTTRGQMQALETAILSYQMDLDQLPRNLEDLINDPGVSGWAGPYTHRGRMPKDAWGREFRYDPEGRHNPGSFDLWSVGPDGVDDQGEGDDIANWGTDD